VPEVGHGQLGLRDDLRIYDQQTDDGAAVLAQDTLSQESSCRTDAFVEIEGRAIISDTWTPLATAGFEIAWDQEFDGEKLDVASVQTSAATLTRVETEAEVEATDNTWQYDMDEGLLRIHLPSDADPSGNSILVTTCFNFGTGGGQREHQVHPYLGESAFVDGTFSEPGIPDWNPADTGTGFSVGTPAALVGGGFSVNLEGDGSGTGSAQISQAPTTAIGKARRLFGYYRTPVDQPATASLYVRVGTTTQLKSNGYGTETLGDGLELTRTHGRVRAFVFDFVSHEADVDVVFKLENSAATACSAQICKVSLRPIYGWRYFHPRVAADGIPESEQGSLDVYSGSASTGSGSVKLLNDSTAPFERMFSGGPWTVNAADIRIRYGGAFPDNGQTILWDDMLLGQSGIIAGDQFIKVTDDDATFSFEEARTILEAEIPSDTYGSAWPDVEERDFSRVRARFFGPQLHIRPARVDVDATTGLGIYEVNDPTYVVGNALADATVYAYVDEEAAEKNDTTKRVTLTNSTDYTVDAAAGTFEIARNPGVFVISSGEGPDNEGANDRIDFTLNAVTYAAALTPGNYTSRSLQLHVAAQMSTISGATVVVSYSNTTHKYTIADATAVTLTLLPNTGVNAHRDALKLLGYTDSDDATYTGALTYTSDTAVFVGPDEQSFIRCDFTGGYCDDASGTYTGAPGNPIQIGPDIFRYIIEVFLKEPGRIDLASFLAARTECPQVLGAYFGLIASVTDTPAGPVTLQSAVDKLEISGATTAEGLADVSQDGAGVFYWRTRNNVTSLLQLFDRDYLTFEGYLNGSDPYGTVRVNYSQDPSTGIVLSVQSTDDDTVLRDRNRKARVFDSYLTVEADAEEARDALAIQARAPMRHFRIRTIGKMLRSKPGDIVLLTRARALGASGDSTLTTDSFRVLWIKKNFLTREVEAVVHTRVES
jgi:hypothetical protein